MGNEIARPIQYSEAIEGTDSEYCSQTYRNVCSKEKLTAQEADLELQNAWDVFNHGVEVARNNRCMGTRKKNEDGSLGEYEWKTYSEVRELAVAVGAGLLKYDLLPVVPFEDEYMKEFRFLGIYAKNCLEWILCEQAANAYGFTMVPLYDTLGADAVSFVLNKTKLRTVAASAECAGKLLSVVADAPLVKDIVVFDQISKELQAAADAKNIRLILMENLIQTGRSNPTPLTPAGLRDVNTICYTSGSTGMPKGVFLTHLNYVCCVIGFSCKEFAPGDITVTNDDVHISYLPLAHSFERFIMSILFYHGSAIGFYGGDVQKLLDDIRVLQPTVFVSVPRLYNRINNKIFSEIKEKSQLSQYLFNRGLNAKLEKMRSTGVVTHSLWDMLIFNKTRSIFGSNLRYMFSGSAPLDVQVHDNMKAFFCVPLVEGYGMTETAGIFSGTSLNDPVSGSIGGPFTFNEFKIESVPEMNYYAYGDDPRGELCVRGANVTPGYFQNAEITSVVDESGWLHTGDVACILPNGSLKIIDRKKELFKLAQGEYISADKIENVYANLPLVAQIFVHGYSTESCLVAVVVVDPSEGKRWGSQNGMADASIEELCKSDKLKKDIMEGMDVLAKKFQIKGFEIVKAIHIISEMFSVENDLMTPTFKMKRFQLRQKFRSEFDEMYAKMKEKQQ